MTQPKTIFSDNIARYTERLDILQRKYTFWSTIRVVFFIAALVLLLYFANDRNIELAIYTLVVFPILFAVLVKFHNKIAFRRKQVQNLLQINKDELKRQKNELKEFDTGREFQNPLHSYTTDLDIFGRHSIFQLLNRTTTTGARALLAKWLIKSTDGNAILQRQEAVKELHPKNEWRQEFQASGMHFQDEESNVNALLEWLAQPDLLRNKLLYQALQIIMSLVAITCLVGYFNDFSVYYLIGALAVNSLILKTVFAAAKDTTEQTEMASKALKAYAVLIHKVEVTEFESVYLKDLKYVFNHADFKASKAIKMLDRILSNLESRANLFYWILNTMFLLDIIWLLRADKWKNQNKENASLWFEAINKFEAINSLAGFSFANPDYIFPGISEKEFELSATSLAHPLINSDERISNDFLMTEKGKIIIITGSNMSGKSTFLRTLGVNIVLALAGAPVCASKMNTSLLQVFTSMRTIDNLEESVSSFYAELKRLKQLLDLLEENNQPILFMLDEILKGTNSQDRHNGATSLIKQLSELKAFGLVSTHDLALGKLSTEMNNVENFSFNSIIEGDEIIFDYKLHDGICKSFNASKLMEKMGIKMVYD